MDWRKVEPGEKAPVILLPEEYVQRGEDENEYSDSSRPRYWQSGQGTVDSPLVIIANASDVKWRIGVDELRAMAAEIRTEKKVTAQQQAVDNRTAWNEALIRGLELAKSEGSKALLKRLKFG